MLGFGNVEIGCEFDFSIKMVEKYIGEIFCCWGVGLWVEIVWIV